MKIYTQKSIYICHLVEIKIDIFLNFIYTYVKFNILKKKLLGYMVETWSIRITDCIFSNINRLNHTSVKIKFPKLDLNFHWSLQNITVSFPHVL